MLPDLQAREAAEAATAPRLLVILSGTAEEHERMGLRAPLLFDQRPGLGARYGAHGTPVAILVDGAGRIAPAVAGGAPAILALAGAQTPHTASA